YFRGKSLMSPEEALVDRAPLRTHVEEVDEEIIRQCLRSLSEDAVLGLCGIGAEHAQTADENRHLGCGQSQQLRASPPDRTASTRDATAKPRRPSGPALVSI